MSETNEVIRVLIASDHPVTRIGIRAVLEKAPGIKVVGEAGNGVQAKQLVAELYPGLLLLDLVMPALQPYQVERWVRSNYPETTTLVLTAPRPGLLPGKDGGSRSGWLSQQGKNSPAVRRSDTSCCAGRGTYH